ncbi:amidohydrolase family protein [Sphingomonas montana]|uniref:amidohydrolase family protein n=1 Tax=Sphingomonas montana TaxID=1843236 RepID=UPI00096F0E8B|nr:amidohydrolase family protein [Sphingomonas montana]
MIDAHVHAWQIDRPDCDWPGADLPALHRDFTLDQWRGQSGGARAILVQTQTCESDTMWLLAQAGGDVAGVIGWTDLAADDAPAAIDRLRAAGPLLGIRPMVQGLAADWYDDPALDRGIARLAERGLVLEALIQPRHLPSLARLAVRHPTLKIVIDHAAKPAVGRDLDTWTIAMRALAAHPQVACKLSGLFTEIVDGAEDAVLPYIQALLAMFGPDRLIWGSDWPVVTLRNSYAAWLGLAREAVPAGQHEAVFGGNAIRIYGLGPNA